MPHKGPHISISPDYVVNRILRINIDDFAEWPESVRNLAIAIAEELFLVAYNPFINADTVRTSVRESFDKEAVSLAHYYATAISEGITMAQPEFPAASPEGASSPASPHSSISSRQIPGWGWLAIIIALLPFAYACGFLFPRGDDFDEVTRAMACISAAACLARPSSCTSPLSANAGVKALENSSGLFRRCRLRYTHTWRR